MNDFTKKLRMFALEVPEGTSKRFICPRCGGGDSKEESFIVTQEKGLLKYICHRASCGVAGYTMPGGDIPLPLPTPRSPAVEPPRPFRGQTKQLSVVQRDFLAYMYGITPRNMQDILYCDLMQRYILKVYDFSFSLRGNIARGFNGQSPKSLNFNEVPEEPFYAWFIDDNVTSRDIVIVEDWLSGCKVMQAGITAVSINGTHMNEAGALEILNAVTHRDWYDRVIIALDPGAASAGLKIMKEFGVLWPETKLMFLDKDLKYEKEEVIKDAIKSGTPLIGSGRQKPASI